MRIVDVPQYSPPWWDVRRGVPTCSAFHRILTPKGKLSTSWVKYACLLIAETFDAYYSVGEEYQDAAYGGEGKYQSEAMEIGALREKKARAAYEYHRGVELREVGFIFADDDMYGGSPDALIGDDGCWEGKSPLTKTHIEYLVGGTVPDKYLPQCHGHLIVTGRDYCDFQSFVPGFPDFIVRVTPDAYTASLRSAVEEFCDKYADMLAKVRAQLEDTIESRIDQHGSQNPTEHKSFLTDVA